MAVNKYNFWDIFQNNSDGSITAIQKILVNGTIIEPGFILRPGIPVGGIDFIIYKDFDVAAEDINDALHIKGFFRRP